jgi:putative spermidine/putrescine transport system permease protein
MAAFGTSVGIATAASALSVVLGTGAAMAVVRSEFRAKSAMMTLLVSPLIVPPVVIGMSLYGFFLRAGLIGSPLGVAAAHAIGGIPLVVVMVASSLQAVDRRMEQAASVHGAAPWRVFVSVTVPAIAPGLGAAAFFAFLHSFDELVLSMFLAGTGFVTLPMKLWGDINYQLNPVLAVVSTLEVVLIVLGLAIARPVLAGKKRTAA